MNRYWQSIILITVSCMQLACSPSEAPQQAKPSVQHVQDYLDAYNRHDINVMLNYLSDDVRWMSVTEDRVSIQTSGKSGLKTILENYFKDTPSTRSEIQHIAANGNFVNAFEKANWENKDGKKQSQCAASVYELEDGLIKNIWYYDSFVCD